jgi:hypothetical protein
MPRLQSLSLAAPLGLSMLSSATITGLSCLPGLTHLQLHLAVMPAPWLYYSSHLSQQRELLKAVAGLAGLRSLELLEALAPGLDLAPLAALRQLTKLRLRLCGQLDSEQVEQVAQLVQLRSLEAPFGSVPDLRRLARLSALEDCHVHLREGAVDVDGLQERPLRLSGALSLAADALRYFDARGLTRLHLQDSGFNGQLLLARMGAKLGAAASCLQALRLDSYSSLEPATLAAVAQLTRLQRLWLQLGTAEAAAGVAPLAAGCGQLQELVLVQAGGLQEAYVAALMGLPGLRALRLVGCRGTGMPDQERCQALLGQLPGLFKLQVDVVSGAASSFRVSKFLLGQLQREWG